MRRCERSPVVVGVDGSLSARRAAVFAAQEAALRGVGLRVVTAVPWSGHEGWRVLAAADVVLAEAVELAQETLTPGRVTSVTAVGKPAAVLVEESRQAELVVLGNRGLGGFAGLMLGSVGVEVAGSAESPVVVVHERGSHGGRGGDSAPVVVGVDGGETSQDTLTSAFVEAALYRAPLLAVHSWTASLLVGSSRLSAVSEQAHRPRDEAAVLAQALAPFREKFPAVEVVERVTEGHAGDALLEASAGARLLVVGSGRGRLAGLFLGSAAQAAIHQARCPVLVVRPLQARSSDIDVTTG
jgi:nucleotide-binding universal stress UspA family protein